MPFLPWFAGVSTCFASPSPPSRLGTVFHFVSIVEEGIVNNRCPIANFYETLAMCAFLVAVVYLGVQLRYRVESLSVFIFPLVFVMSLVSTSAIRSARGASPIVRTHLAHRAHRARPSRVCGTGVHRGGLPSLSLPGARAQVQKAQQILLPAARPWARSTSWCPSSWPWASC